MQEVFTLLAMAALAALIIAVGGIVVWHFQDAQKAADWAVAYVYPMAKPVNTTHFWLGAQAAFADVEISHVLVDNTTYLLGVRAPQGRQVWLNYSGRPLLVKCNSTVAFEVERGKASRSLTFRAVCPVKKQSTNLEDIKTMLVSYANFVLDYVVNNHSALLTAYFKHDGVYIRNNWDRPLIVAVDPPIGAFYPDLASLSTGFRIIVLLPGEEHRLIPMDTAGAAVVYYRDTLTTLEFPSLLNRWVYSQIDPLGGNWLLWVNGVQAYNGTAPASGETPQGIPFEIRPGGYYRLGDQNI
ncbi:MAG: hypothetical protein OWQ51_08820, partial [Pyrobaculum arsenaticum]|uniref:hypothetical protein n=1 Tax=Pyrobaculum arsenaticum TaxID=121277 RepID=UPI0022747902|nr:hypothetical protein [Pyrobaculum arsenaticum]